MATDHVNDPNILDTERLFRRVNVALVVEGEEGSALLSSSAFGDLELSVNLESIMQAASREPRDSLRNYPNDLLVAITAGICREKGQLVGPDPTPAEPAHGYAFGKKSKSVQRALRDSAVWIVPQAAPTWEEVLDLKTKAHYK